MPKLIAFFLLALVSPIMATALDPLAHNGILDLSKIDFAQQKDVKLAGEWNFFPHALKSTQDCRQETSPYISVPGYWDSHLSQNAATYCLHILLSPNQSPLTLYLPEQESAYKLWVNDSLYAVKGVVNLDQTQVRPGLGDTLVLLPALQELALTVQIASSNPNQAGMSSALMLGAHSVLASKILQHQIIDASLIGALFFIGLYHLILFFHRRRNWSYLSLSIVCLSWSASFAAYGSGSRLLPMLIPGISYNVCNAFELIPLFTIPGLLFHFFYYNFPRVMPKWMLMGIVSICSVCVLWYLLAPEQYSFWLVPSFQLFSLVCFVPTYWYLVKAIRLHLLGSIHILFGTLILCAASVNDVLFDMRLIDTCYVMNFGILALVLSVAFALSRNYAQTFLSIERLTVDLKDRNEKLSDQFRILHENQELKRTLEKQSEYLRQMLLTRRNLEQILNAIKEPLFACQSDGDIVYANAACLKLLERSTSKSQVFSLDDWLAQGSIANQSLREIIHSNAITIDHQEIPEITLLDATGSTHICHCIVSTMAVDERALTICIITQTQAPEARAIIQEINQQQSRAEEWELLRQAYSAKDRKKNPKLDKILKAIDSSIAEVQTLLQPKQRSDVQLVEQAVELLLKTIAYWEECNPAKTKIDLARESGLWTVYVNRDGWERTQTLDRYLLLETFPQQARWDRVVKTVEFALASPINPESETRKTLEGLLEKLKSLLE